MKTNRFKKFRRLMLAILLGLCLTAGSCDSESEADKTDREFSDRVAKNFTTGQPPHEYDASQARENLLAAQDAMALGADSWTFQTIEGKGVNFQCPSRGLPLPFGTQITNPDKITSREGGDVVTSQIEPYGLFPPKDVRGTLANCVLPDGQIGIWYSEPDITTYTFDVTLNPTTGILEVSKDAKSSVSVHKVTKEEVNIHPAEK